MRKLTLVLMALALTTSFAFAGGNDFEGYEFTSSVNSYQTQGTAKADTTVAAFWDFSQTTNPTQGSLQDWTPVDTTLKVPKWHVEDFNVPVGSYCAWAGERFLNDCGSGNQEGYANNYLEYLDWFGSVGDELLGVAVNVTATVNVDTEPGYDYLYLQHEAAGSMVNDAQWDNLHIGAAVDVTFNLLAGEYVGTDGVHIRWLAASDGAWSDSDCDYTTVAGHSQLDNVVVTFDQGTGAVEQSNVTFEDQTLGDWYTVVPENFGNFGQVWDFLGDIDPCVDNVTPQCAFIDDGLIVPGVGPSLNVLWTYGPDSYVVNSTHGLTSDPSININNAIWSPIIDVDPADAGHEIRFSAYRHFEIYTMAGCFYTWDVRSSPDGIVWSGWANRGWVHYGGPDYIRQHEDVSDLLIGGSIYAQISLQAVTPWASLNSGNGATPAPYFDNVSWHTYDFSGPGLAYREFEIGQDNFPAALDWGDLGGADVPFIQGNDIVGTDGPGIIHGDSLVLNIDAFRAGAALTEKPRMYYTVKTNPVFDTLIPDPRTSGWAYTGYVDGDTVFAGTTPIQGRWSFDLADADFLYPGDVVHYYFSATDTAFGEAPVTSTLPAALDGFGVFTGDAGYIPWQWPSDFTVHCLPTVLSTTAGDVPDMLMYNDNGDRGGENEWEGTLNALGFVRGVDYDIYYTNSPSSGTGNGLGSTCTAAILGNYRDVLYTAGGLDEVTLNGAKFDDGTDEFAGDGSNDIALLAAYIDAGGNFFGTGDGFIGGTIEEGDGSGVNFVNTYFGIDFTTYDVRPQIDAQSAPTVAPVANASGLAITENFVAYGSCPNFKEFDGITENAAVESHRVAEFLAPDGTAGAYTDYAAMVANERVGAGKVVVCPVDFLSWYTPYGKATPGIAVRVNVLCDVLKYFAANPAYCDAAGATVGADTPQPFFAKNWPNPFNPITKINFNMPRNGHISMKIFNVRGELVRTLIDDSRDAGEYTVEWDGSDDRGQSVASGVYFYETRTAGKSIVNKMALVK
jgi:hypothetical protein